MGLNGWFGKIFKKVITVIGSAIGGPVGGAVAAQLFEVADNLFFSNSLTVNTGWFGQKSKNLQSTNKDDSTPQTQQEINLQKWFEEKITDKWVNTFFKPLNPTNAKANIFKEDWYRKEVNKILLQLETLRLYYTGKTEKSKVYAKSININVDEIIENENITNKAQFFEAVIIALRKAYETALKVEGKLIYNKTIKNFKANHYSLQGKAPEPIHFDFKATSNIDLYVFDVNEVINITYTNGSNSTAEPIVTTPNTPNLSTFVNNNNKVVRSTKLDNKNGEFTPNFNITSVNPSVTKKKTQNALLWIMGIVSGAWLLKKYF